MKLIKNDIYWYVNQSGEISPITSINKYVIDSIDATVQLREIPSVGTLNIKKIITILNQDDVVKNFEEILSGNITQANQFIVDYTTNEIQFHTSQKGKEIIVKCMSEGNVVISANNVYMSKDSNGNIGDTVENKINENKRRVDQIENLVEISINSMNEAIVGKVDKVEGKSLSSNDYTEAERQEVLKIKDKANQSDLISLSASVDRKVDKVDGKELSTNDFTNGYKSLLDDFLNKTYPIGSIYLSMVSTNPSTLFGGEWQKISQGRVLVGVNDAESEFNTVNKIGGEKSHTLTVEEIASHGHTTSVNGKPTVAGNQSVKISINASSSEWCPSGDVLHETIGNTGGSMPHNNLQPYLTCYMWQRTN